MRRDTWDPKGVRGAMGSRHTPRHRLVLAVRMVPDWLKHLFVSDDRRPAFPDGVFSCAMQVPIDGDDVPDWITLLSVGEYLNHPDGPHRVEVEQLEEMVESFQATSTDLLVDKDHDSLWGSDTRATGWITEIRVEDGALQGRFPEWTPFGEDLVSSREYRYISPVYALQTEGKDGTPGGAKMYSVALTNAPYMDEGEVDAVSSTSRTTQNSSDNSNAAMNDREKIIALLGLDDDATDDQVDAAYEAHQEAQSNAGEGEPNDDGSDGDGSDGDGSDDGGPDDDDSGDDEDFDAKVNAAVQKALQRERDAGRAEDLIDQAIEDGKIQRADREIFLNSARADFQKTKERLGSLEKNASLPDGVKTDDGDPTTKRANSKTSRSDAVTYLKAQRGA